MKRKIYSIIFMVLFFLAAGAFYFEGAPDNTVANQDTMVEESEAVVKNETVEEMPELLEGEVPPKDSVEENKVVKQNETETETENTKPIVKDSDSPKIISSQDDDEQEDVNKDTETEDPTTQEENTNTSSNPEAPADTITLDGTLYVLTMDETKYSNLTHLIKIARHYDALLYGIPFSDSFVMIKEGERICNIELGFISAKPAYADIIKAKLADSHKNIGENIDFVLETGATITVEWESTHFFYKISIKDGWLQVNYF
ncbi:hypothetical protein [Cytobacillus firmus]|uniref:hypothetical protein n=1 Tax=Cytobacillus firmus TaxID=1399 RepID=UPI003001998F